MGLRPNELLPFSLPHPDKGSCSPPPLCPNPNCPPLHCLHPSPGPPPPNRASQRWRPTHPLRTPLCGTREELQLWSHQPGRPQRSPALCRRTAGQLPGTTDHPSWHDAPHTANEQGPKRLAQGVTRDKRTVRSMKATASLINLPWMPTP